MSKEETLFQRELFSQILLFFSILFTDYSRTGYHLKAKILKQGEIFFFRGHIPVQGQVPPPRDHNYPYVTTGPTTKQTRRHAFYRTCRPALYRSRDFKVLPNQTLLLCRFESNQTITKDNMDRFCNTKTSVALVHTSIQSD